MCSYFVTILLVSVASCVHGSKEPQIFLRIEGSVNDQVQSQSLRYNYEVGDILCITCNVAKKLFDKKPTLFWTKNKGDEFHHNSNDYKIRYQIRLGSSDDELELRCGARVGSEVESISVTFYRNKTTPDILTHAQDSNPFVIILISLGGIILAAILLLVVYRLISGCCCNKKPSDDASDDIPMQPKTNINYSEVDLAAKRNKVQNSTNDDVSPYAYAEVGIVNLNYKNDTDSCQIDSDSGRKKTGRNVIIFENMESATVC